jgi:hypothetical protein
MNTVEFGDPQVNVVIVVYEENYSRVAPSEEANS